MQTLPLLTTQPTTDRAATGGKPRPPLAVLGVEPPVAAVRYGGLALVHAARRSLQPIASLASLLLFGPTHVGCTAGTVVNTNAKVRARATIERMLREHEIPGGQYCVVDADRTLLELHVGHADVASSAAVSEQTWMMAYSLTKVVTAIAVMQLVDQGKATLDDALSAAGVEHPYGPEVTIRALLSHTAGVPNPMPLDWFALEGEPLDRHQALYRVLDAHPRLDREVGAAYGYTNVGYWLLERWIEAVSGQDYAAYVRAHVFAPLGVPASALDFDPGPANQQATGHSRRFAPINALLHVMTPRRYWVAPRRGWSRVARLRAIGRGYGGLYASAAALAPVLQDLLRQSPRLLSAKARDQLFTQQHTRSGKALESTLAFVIGELEGVRYFGKQGGGLGFHGNMRIYPELGIASVWLSNRTEISPGPIDARSDAIDVGFVREHHERADHR